MKHASFIFILYSYIFKLIDTTVSKAYPYLYKKKHNNRVKNVFLYYLTLINNIKKENIVNLDLILK